MKKGNEINTTANQKDKVDPIKKQTLVRNPKDLIPLNSQFLKNIRETFPLKQNDISSDKNKEIKEVLIFSKPFEILPEWPNEEELKVFSSNQVLEKESFTDPFNKKIIFPSIFEDNFAHEAKWLRPEDYIKNNLLNKEIKISFPNKNLIKIRNEIKDFYHKHEIPNKQARKDLLGENYDNDNEDDYLYDKNTNIYQFNLEAIDKSNFGDKSQANIIDILHKKRNAFKDCFKILDKKLDINIVNWIERDENDEEYKLRKEKEIQEKLKQLEKEKESKNKKKPENITTQNKGSLSKELPGNKADLEHNLHINERLKIKEIKPSNLYLPNEPMYNSYIKWILSILQMIKDLNICDAQTKKSIILNIYPQKDGFPTVSPSGKYWIKMYLFGEARLVEIDNLIPCSKNEEFIFPRCDKLNEIWPALITKAILKLHSYKRLSKYCEETGDLAIIYSVTGYIAEKLPINSLRVSNLEKYLQSNENYIHKQKIIACLAWDEEEELNNINKLSLKSNKNQKIKDKQFDLTKNSSINKSSSKGSSLVSVNSNLSKIPEEVQKIENENKAFKNNKNNSKKRKQELSSSKINDELTNPYNSKAFSDKNIMGNPSNDHNYFNFLKNIPEENNFDLEKNNYDQIINSENKIHESSGFNSVNNDNNSDMIENKGNNSYKKTLEDDINNKNDIYQIIRTPKNPDFGLKTKNTFSRSKLNKTENIKNRRRSSVAFLIQKGKEEFKIENSQFNAIYDKDNGTTNIRVNKDDMILNTLDKNVNEQRKYETETQTGQKYLVSMGRNDNNFLKTSKNIIKFDYNLDSAGKPDSQRRDDIISNYIYPVLDFFDNKKFNMQRLKPLDFSDIIKLGQECGTPGIYKQLSKEDKKKYLENLLEVKTKQREMKNKRIEEIKKEGRRYNFIKIKNNTIGIPKLNFDIPYTEQEIIMTKKCLENTWEFPPPYYFDNNENENIDNSTLNLTERDDLHKNEDFTQKKKFDRLEEFSNSPRKERKETQKLNISPTNNQFKTFSSVKEKNVNNNQNQQELSDKLNSNNEKFRKENMKEEDLKLEYNKDSNEDTLKNENKINKISENKKAKNWSREMYLNIINNDLGQYENPIEPLVKYSGGLWLNYIEFKKFFNFFILMHHPESFKHKHSYNNLWVYNDDCYEYNKNTSVIFLNNLNENVHESLNEADNENLNNEEFSNTKREKIIQEKKSTLFILFEPNNNLGKTNEKEFEDLFYYANFDLIDSFGKEIQSNIILSKFYSTYFNENLEKEKNYFLILKSFVCPFGFNFSVYSDHRCDNLDYGTYLKKFNGFVNKVFKIDHAAFERNKTSLIGKFKLKLVEKTYIKININYSDKLIKKFIDVYLYFGRSSQNKKRISFDLNEKILFEPLPLEDEYILVIVINPPFVINTNFFEVDFYYDKTSANITLIDSFEPFKLYDGIKANKYGIVFKEFIFAFKNTYLTFELKIQKRNNLSNTENHNNNSKLLSKDSNITPTKFNTADNININSLQKLLYSEEDMFDKIRMKLQILKSNELIFEEEFFDKINIQNMILNYEPRSISLTSDVSINQIINSKEQKNNTSSAQMNIIQTKEIEPYLMICVFDLSELKIPKESLENLEWVLRVFASEPVLFTKDTTKEDSEKYLKDNWENNELGRSEKAKRSRLIHLIKTKKNMGTILSIEEQQLLLEDRPKTVATSSLMQHLENNNLKAGRDIEKDKKGVKESNKEISNNFNNPKNKINAVKNSNSNLPKLYQNNNIITESDASSKSLLKLDKSAKTKTANPLNHKNLSIRDFLQYTIQERIIQKDSLIEKDKSIFYILINYLIKELILNEHCVKNLNEQINKQVENYETVRKTEGDEILNKSILIKENLKTFYKTTNTFRIQARDNCSSLYKQRDLLRCDLIKVIEIESSINEILCGFNIDFNYSTIIYKESGLIEGVKPKLRERLFKFISAKKDEFYKNEIKKISNKDKNIISKYIEDIEENKWFVSPEIVIKLKELINSFPKK